MGSKQRDPVMRKMRCVSEHRTAADRMYTDGRYNDLYVKVDCGHILILHYLLSSYCTPLQGHKTPKALGMWLSEEKIREI